MKGIMFNTKYGLEQAVLNSYKTRTWRADAEPRYEVGEIVAIKQSYSTIVKNSSCEFADMYDDADSRTKHNIECSAGWNNKMFVKNEYMPHQIRITAVYPCRLQDLTERQVLEEGIEKVVKNIFGGNLTAPVYTFRNADRYCSSAKEAFAWLINKLNRQGYWRSNPDGYAYEFELVK